MTVRFFESDGTESSLNEETGELTSTPRHASSDEPRIIIRWDRIAQLISAIVLCVMGFVVAWSMLVLLDDPLPPCTSATIQHACSGEP